MNTEKLPPDLSIIIPVYNEEENLKELYARILSALAPLGKSFEIIFVDDGSKDNSFSVLENISLQDRRVKVISFRRNYGQTAAMSAGIDVSRGRILIFMDADLQNDPSDIPRLLSELDKGFDAISGWRRNRKDRFLTRKLPSMIANRLIAYITGVRLHDFGCTLKAFKREFLEEVRLFGEMHRFIAAYAYWQGARVGEIEVTHHPREHGKSKYGLKRIFNVLMDLVTVSFMGGYITKPIYFFGLAAAFLVFMGLIVFGYVLYMKFFLSISMIQTPLPTLVAILLIIAAQLVLMGLLAELIIRIYHEASHRPQYRIRVALNIEPRSCSRTYPEPAAFSDRSQPSDPSTPGHPEPPTRQDSTETGEPAVSRK